MKKLLLTGLLGFVSFSGFSQVFITDPDFPESNPMDCAALDAMGTTNFFDQGGQYDANMDEVIVLCPDLTQGSKASIAFATNIGYIWDVHPSDTLYFFDGPSTSSPLIGAYNSAVDPSGPFIQASFDNPSGCLTARFVSNGANQGEGWNAKLACGNPAQPFIPHVEVFVNGGGPNTLNPIDTGYINMCYGDSVLFVAKPEFPFALENTGTGYSQTADNAVYSWVVAGYGPLSSSNDSVWFSPPSRTGFFIDLRIQDPFPHSERITFKVRVSQQPIFAGTGPLEDTVCFGEQTELIGGVTPSDTVGVDVPGGVFNMGGSFAGLTFLPDGTGDQYTTAIAITDFGSSTIVDSSSISTICLTIEHSFIGDLEIGLQCPNGTIVSLMNTYDGTGGLFPGGGPNSGIFLGNDTNIDGGDPGTPVWTYCFSSTNATQGSIPEEIGNTIQNDYGFAAMNPDGIYAPDGDFNDFIGCPINGDWTIIVQDNQGIDDGYIFEWAAYFDASLNPNAEKFQNSIVSDFWTADPTIISGQNDTSIVVVPNAYGNHSYTYNVTDDFGCEYDTTVVLFTAPQPEIFPSTPIGCFDGYNITGTTAFGGGVWSSTAANISFSDPTDLNPSVSTTQSGIYPVTFTDNICGTAITSTINFPGTIYTQVLDTIICTNSPYVIYALPDSDIDSYLWNTGETTPYITITNSGEYIVTVSNECYTQTDTATIVTKVCDIWAPNVITLSSNNGNNFFFVNYDGVQTYNCIIVNRWGNKIYEYSDPAGTWNGTNMNGDVVEEGVYFYTIEAEMINGEALTKQGFVQVFH